MYIARGRTRQDGWLLLYYSGFRYCVAQRLLGKEDFIFSKRCCATVAAQKDGIESSGLACLQSRKAKSPAFHAERHWFTLPTTRFVQDPVRIGCCLSGDGGKPTGKTLWKKKKKSFSFFIPHFHIFFFAEVFLASYRFWERKKRSRFRYMDNTRTGKVGKWEPSANQLVDTTCASQYVQDVLQTLRSGAKLKCIIPHRIAMCVQIMRVVCYIIGGTAKSRIAIQLCNTRGKGH